MNKQQLFENIQKKKSFLCVGLDTDIKKIPEHLLKEEDPIFAFNKAIIDATAPYCIAYKPNLAFYESMGVKDGSLSKRLYPTSRKTIPTNSSLPMQNVAILETLRLCMPAHSLKSWTLTQSP